MGVCVYIYIHTHKVVEYVEKEAMFVSQSDHNNYGQGYTRVQRWHRTEFHDKKVELNGRSDCAKSFSFKQNFYIAVKLLVFLRVVADI